MLTVKNVKTFRGMEGDGFNANLYFDNKKICFVMDSANGGEYDYEWEGKTMEDRRKHEALFKDFIKALPPEKLPEDAEAWEKSLYPNGFREISEDGYISDLIDKYNMDKHRKRSVLFRTPESKYGQFYKIKHNGRIEETKKYVLENYPGAVLI